MNRFYKNFIIDIVIAVIALALAITILPPFGIGQKILNILFALVLIAYLALYLFNKVRRGKGRILILRICEFTVISIIALGLIFQQFHLFNISGVCAIIGAVLWLRGVSSLTGMYLTAANTTKNRYSLPKFAGCIAIMTVGTFFFAKPIVTDEVITWILCVIFFLAAIGFAGLAILFAPTKKAGSKKPKTKTEKPKTEEIEEPKVPKLKDSVKEDKKDK